MTQPATPKQRSTLRRSCLSVPGGSLRMQAKAAGLAADQLMFDLEDSVVAAEKEGARANIVESLSGPLFQDGDWTLSVRVNDVSTRWFLDDVLEVVRKIGNRIQTVVLPKAESPNDVVLLDGLLTQIERTEGWEPGAIGIEPQIESARSLQQVEAIAGASPRVAALIFGPGDYAASLGLSELTIGRMNHSYLSGPIGYALNRILVAARAAGVLAIDGPYGLVNDPEGLERSARAAAELGFDGKWAIHPSQIEPINAALTPDEATYRKAVAMLEAYGGGAVRVGGEMIDEANRKMAESIVARGSKHYAQ